jgi:hypothetical protein
MMEGNNIDMGEYYNEVEEIALEGFKRLNATDHVEQKKWDVGAVGSWEVSVVRGEVSSCQMLCLRA